MKNKVNPGVSGVAPSGRTVLFLTNIHKTQQILTQDQAYKRKQYIRSQRYELKQRLFYTRAYASLECRKRRFALLEYNNGVLTKATFKKPGCNAWTCPDCQKRKALHVKYMLRDIIILNKLGYFLTLTLDPKKLPPEVRSEDVNFTHKHITKLFNHFITVLKRKTFSFYSDKFHKMCRFKIKPQENILKYIWVAEFQPQTGNCHLHVLFNQYLPIVVIRDLWKHVGGGHSMRIELVKTIAGISNYISDYIVKGLKNECTDYVSGFHYFDRRYAVSLSCDRHPKKMGVVSVYSDLTDNQKAYALEADGIGWVYNHLYQENCEDHIVEVSPCLSITKYIPCPIVKYV